MVKILEGTVMNPITRIGEMAGICWGCPINDAQKNYKRGLNCINANHGRTLEFPVINLSISGYSARVIREWYTHIGGAPTRLQESTRYVDCAKFNVYKPNTIFKNDIANKVWDDTISVIREAYKTLDDLSIPREDIANLLPLGMTTAIVDQRNLRNFIDMCKQRMCTRAYKEYRELMNEILEALRNYSDEWKYIVENYCNPKCEELGYCPEAIRSCCGKKPPKKYYKKALENLNVENEARKNWKEDKK